MCVSQYLPRCVLIKGDKLQALVYDILPLEEGAGRKAMIGECVCVCVCVCVGGGGGQCL